MVDGEGVQASIGAPLLPDYVRPIYANQINSVFSPHDFRLIFSLLTVPFAPIEGTNPGDPIELHPQVVADVIIPATVMHAFIGVMNTTFEQYLNQFGPPGLDPEGPGRMGT